MTGRQKTTEEFISESRGIHGDRYDYSLVEYRQANKKVKIVCLEHGVFEQDASHHLRGRGCSRCAANRRSNLYRHTVDQFIRQSKWLHGDTYDYSLVEYKGWDVGVSIVCREHGVFVQKPTYHLQGSGCPQCGREGTMVALGKEQEIDGEYRKGESCVKIGARLGISDTAVLDVLKRAGVSRRHCGRSATYQMNHEYFEKIDTPEKAYWLGWMASDGYVVHTKYAHAVGICLQERDREIIDAFMLAIGAEHPVRTIHINGKTYFEIRVTSLQMVEDLERYGIVPNKSLTLRCPEIVEGLQWDFFRGMFDGDGYVGRRNISLCGTRYIVEAFAGLCRKSEYGSQVYKHSRGTSTWYMRASGMNARGILGRLYGEGKGLIRKREKALEWIERMRGRDERLAA